MTVKWNHTDKPPTQLLAHRICGRFILALPLPYSLAWSKSQCWQGKPWVVKGSFSRCSMGKGDCWKSSSLVYSKPTSRPSQPSLMCSQQAGRFCKQPLDQFIDRQTVRQWDHQGALLCPLGQRSASDALRNGSNFLPTGGFY